VKLALSGVQWQNLILAIHKLRDLVLEYYDEYKLGSHVDVTFSVLPLNREQ
jgi:hypothetical protein